MRTWGSPRWFSLPLAVRSYCGIATPQTRECKFDYRRVTARDSKTAKKDSKAASGSGNLRVPALDGIRGYAVLGVVTLHLLGASGVLARTEGTGLGVWIWGCFGNTIDAFFIISGFVLFLPAARSGGDIGGAVRFWTHRAARLLPALWLVLAIVLLLAAIHPPLPNYTYPSLSEIVSNVAVLQMPAAFASSSQRIGFAIDGPLWAISVIVTFYAVLPLISRSYFRHALIGLGIAALISIGWKEMAGRTPELLLPFTSGDIGRIRLLGPDQFPGWAYSFAAGMTGAWAYLEARSRWSTEQLARAAQRALPAAALIYLIAAYLRGRYALTVPGNVAQAARSHPIETVLETTTRAALMGVVVIGPAWLARPFVNRPTARLAELSYGVYLIHFVVILYAADLLGLPSEGTFADLLLWAVVVMPVSLLFAIASRRFVELPFLARVRTWQSNRDQAPSQQPQSAIPADPARLASEGSDSS